MPVSGWEEVEGVGRGKADRLVRRRGPEQVVAESWDANLCGVVLPPFLDSLVERTCEGRPVGPVDPRRERDRRAGSRRELEAGGHSPRPAEDRHDRPIARAENAG